MEIRLQFSRHHKALYTKSFWSITPPQKQTKKCTFHFSSAFVENIYLLQQILSELFKTYPDMHIGLFMWSLHSCCVKRGIPTMSKMKIQIIWHIVLCWLVNRKTHFFFFSKYIYLPNDKVSHLHYFCSSLTKIRTYCYTVNELQNIKPHENMLRGYLQLLILNVTKTQSTQNEIISLTFFNTEICTNFPNIRSGFTVFHIKKYTQRQHVCMHPFMCTYAQFTERRVTIRQVCTHPKFHVTQTNYIWWHLI
jgi:hypothetical protein